MAPQQELSGAEIGIVLGFYGFICLFAFGIQLLISYILYNSAKSIPEQFQQAVPGQAFLMLIPLFNIVWIFIYPKNLSLSFQNLFRAYGQQTDDCGEQLGLYWAIASVCGMIPCIGIFFGLAGLVCMIMYLIKANDCKNRALSLGNATMKPTQGYAQPNPPRKSDNPYDSGF